MQTSQSCIAIRHLPFESLDSWEPVIRECFEFDYLDIARQRLDDSCDPDLLIVLGGPVGVNDSDEYPFIDAELSLLEKRLANGKPTLGICLGAQLMANALGAKVEAGATREIGWMPVDLTEAGKQSSLRHVGPENCTVFHWHSDNFELPADATLLASTTQCPNQAFSLGPNILGLQFHPEVSASALETWYVGHHRALSAQDDLSAVQLRSDAARYSEALESQGRKLLLEWLEGLRFA